MGSEGAEQKGTKGTNVGTKVALSWGDKSIPLVAESDQIATCEAPERLKEKQATLAFWWEAMLYCDAQKALKELQ